MRKKLLFICLIFALTFSIMLIPEREVVSYAASENAKSTILIERFTGKVLKENNSDLKLPIASVTKLMTILLTLEKLDANEINLTDKVLVSENANGMGGSQIFLDANVEYELGELLKSVIVASANDSSVALAEYIAGSEQNFVQLMNTKASELGLKNTYYSNCTGLPTVDAYSTAHDQAIILNNVLDYDVYKQYSSIWLEDFAHPSGRTTQMTNTNKLSKFYSGCLGGKTGSTNQAKYCLAVGAKRDDLELISVVLGAESSKERFNIASNLLNEGFSEYSAKTIFSNEDLKNKTIKIKGMDRATTLKAEKEYKLICKKDEHINYNLNFNLPNMLTKVKENEVVGNVEIVIDGVVADKINILACNTFEEATLWDYFKEIINK